VFGRATGPLIGQRLHNLVGKLLLHALRHAITSCSTGPSANLLVWPAPDSWDTRNDCRNRSARPKTRWCPAVGASACGPPRCIFASRPGWCNKAVSSPHSLAVYQRVILGMRVEILCHGHQWLEVWHKARPVLCRVLRVEPAGTGVHAVAGAPIAVETIHHERLAEFERRNLAVVDRTIASFACFGMRLTPARTTGSPNGPPAIRTRRTCCPATLRRQSPGCRPRCGSRSLLFPRQRSQSPPQFL